MLAMLSVCGMLDELLLTLSWPMLYLDLVNGLDMYKL